MVAVVVVVGRAAVAPLCFVKTDLVSSIYSNIVDGTACTFDIVAIPMEGIVPVALLLAGICELCDSVQKIELELYVLQNISTLAL